MAHRGDPVTRRVPRPSLRALCTWAAVAAAIVLACTTDTAIGPDAALDSLYIEPMNATIVVDDTLRLTAIGIDHNGRRFADTRAQWSTGNAAISVSTVGVAIGLNTGLGMVRATVGGKTATAMVTVQPKPAFATSRDSVPFTAIANGPVPTTERVVLTNGGGGSLTPAVDTISYGPGATGWLNAALSGFIAPDTLALDVLNTALPTGTYTATVSLKAQKATNSPKSIKVTLVVGVGTPTTMTVDSGDAQTATVNTAVPVKPTVLVRDQYGNPVPGFGVTFAVIFGGGTVNPTASVATDGSGKARATTWTLGTIAGPDTLRAAAAGLTALKFAATGTAGAPAATSKSAGDGQSATVATAVAVPPTLLVTDQFGNPVESVTVMFTTASGSLTGGIRKTNGAGLAAVGSWTLGTQAGPNSLSATAASLPAATFSATGTPGAADSITRAAGDAQTDTVGATLATAYAVRVADQYGNAVSNVTVNWAASGGSITASSLTNGSGIASATRVLGTAAGPQGATATASGLIGSPVAFTATATHGNPTTILKFSGDAQSATAGSPVAIPPTAKVIDQFSNAVAGVGVTFAVTGGGGSVVPTTAISTDTAGKATVTSWTLGPAAGTNNDSLRASAAGLPAVTFLASGLSGTAKNLVLVSGDAQSDTIGTVLTQYVVQVTDALSNGVPNVPVTWQVTAGGGSITPSSNTDVNGFATATRVLGTTVGVDSATASVGGLTGSPVHFGATALHGNPAQIFKIAGDGQSATVNTAVVTPPRVQITDRAGNAIQSANVTFTVTFGGGSTLPASPATLATDGGGFAQLTSWTLGTVAGGDTVTATSTGTPGTKLSATGTPDAPSASQSSVVDNAATITACSGSCTVAGGTADSVTVTVRDQFNNLISGASVIVGSTGTSNQFSPSPSGTSNVNGVFAAKLNSTVAEAKTITGTATTGLGGGGITQTAALTVNPTTPTTVLSSVTASVGTITACQIACVVGSTAATITATVRDTFNNAINGAAVTLSSNGTNNYFGGVLQNSISGTSSGGGTYSAAYNSGTAQLKTLTATITSGTTIIETTPVTVNAAAPASVTVSNQSVAARVGTGVGTLPVYTVLDAFSNLVPNTGVSISSSGGGAPSPTSGFTNASGQFALTSWTMGATGTETTRGQFVNTATLTAGSATAAATDSGFYIFSGDVSPLIGAPCTGCHYTVWTYAAIVGVASHVNDATYMCQGRTLVASGSAATSLMYQKVNWPAPCGANMPIGGPQLSPGNLAKIRAWINRSAINN